MIGLDYTQQHMSPPREPVCRTCGSNEIEVDEEKWYCSCGDSDYHDVGKVLED
jgi:hypothetical protein